mmetsp:Transcript_22487/g.52905  ORF Transcript_22487/g.52905 Transcript_22487/m.52905 type:complete len:248 (+) Transcript_22487:166-909(+)
MAGSAHAVHARVVAPVLAQQVGDEGALPVAEERLQLLVRRRQHQEGVERPVLLVVHGRDGHEGAGVVAHARVVLDVVGVVHAHAADAGALDEADVHRLLGGRGDLEVDGARVDDEAIAHLLAEDGAVAHGARRAEAQLHDVRLRVVRQPPPGVDQVRRQVAVDDDADAADLATGGVVGHDRVVVRQRRAAGRPRRSHASLAVAGAGGGRPVGVAGRGRGQRHGVELEEGVRDAVADAAGRAVAGERN